VTRGITDLEHALTSSVSEDALVRGYDVQELSISRVDGRPRRTQGRAYQPFFLAVPPAEYSVGRRLFRPCACGTFIGALPDDHEDIEERLTEHHLSDAHVDWRHREGL
jgi:hypothetical protein